MKLRRKSNRDDSIWRLRYGSQTKYRNLCKSAHKKTHNICCVCLTCRSIQIHHAYYGNDIIGKSIFPVCQHCHYYICHDKANWSRCPKNPVWENRNTEEFIDRLRAGYESLVNETAPIFESRNKLKKIILCYQENLKAIAHHYKLAAINLKLTLSLDEASVVSGLSKNLLRTSLKTGMLVGRKLGKGWKIRPQDLDKFLDKCFLE